jgi:hypothetical protein
LYIPHHPPLDTLDVVEVVTDDQHRFAHLGFQAFELSPLCLTREGGKIWRGRSTEKEKGA